MTMIPIATPMPLYPSLSLAKVRPVPFCRDQGTGQACHVSQGSRLKTGPSIPAEQGPRV